jgi:protein-S-isoprenylcysteine O-methyltransferase Ste14
MDPYTVAQAAGIALAIPGAAMLVWQYTYWRSYYDGELLTGGPYGFVRHPQYAGFLYLITGIALASPNEDTIALALFSVAYLAYWIGKEEAALVEKYGRSYEEYKRKVPWRIVPRVI